MTRGDHQRVSDVGRRRIKRMGDEALTWALESTSPLAPDIFASIASKGELELDDLVRAVKQNKSGGLSPTWVARAGLLVAYQSTSVDDLKRAKTLLGYAVPLLGRGKAGRRSRKALVEVLIELGLAAQAENVLKADRGLADSYHGYLRTDAQNPWLAPGRVDFKEWLKAFNRPFRNFGLTPVEVSMGEGAPFDTLTETSPSTNVEGSGLITVALTTYRPVAEELITSVKSILNQTWRSLELIVVDDCSGEEYSDLLKEASELDPRIRLVRLPVNGGTYAARNEALKLARGLYFTGQDTDDWSHPQRLEIQMRELLDRPETVGVTTSAIRMDQFMVRSRIGMVPNRRCEVSLLVRTADARAIGGFVPVRRGADSEFRSRLEAWSDKDVLSLEHPLYLTRMTSGSLSRSDFQPGWSHPGRRAFSSSYRRWHETAGRKVVSRSSAKVPGSLPIVLPPRISGDPTPRTFDVCIAADWRGFEPIQRAAVDDLKALVGAGLRVAILQVDAPFAHAVTQTRFVPEIQDMANRGDICVTYVDADDHVRLLIVRDPSPFHFASTSPSDLSVDKVLVVADGLLPNSPAIEQKYSPEQVQQVCSSKFGLTPIWARIAGDTSESQLPSGLQRLSRDYPQVLAEAWFMDYSPVKFASDMVSIGRCASNSDRDWPLAAAQSLAYPSRAGTFDVQVLGDARGYLRGQALDALPSNWLSFRYNDIHAVTFLSSLDAVVHFDSGDSHGSVNRNLLEAMAVGTLVVSDIYTSMRLDRHVVETEPVEVPATIRELSQDGAAYAQICRDAQLYARRECDPRRLIDLIEDLLSPESTGNGTK